MMDKISAAAVAAVLAACATGGLVRAADAQTLLEQSAEARMQLDDLLDQAGVPLDVRERAFADRHDLMERA